MTISSQLLLNEIPHLADIQSELSSSGMAIGILTGIALLPQRFEPTEWLPLFSQANLMANMDVEQSNLINDIQSFHSSLSPKLIGDLACSLTESNQTADFSLGIAMAMDWGSDYWARAGFNDSTPMGKLVRSLMVIAITLATEKQRENKRQARARKLAEHSLPDALQAVFTVTSNLKSKAILH